MPEINVWATIISMVGSVVLGFIWYGPLFGKAWMEVSGIKMTDQKPPMSVMIKPIILSLIGAFFMVFMFTSLLAFRNAYYVASGYEYGSALAFAFVIWLGFVAPTYFNFIGWEGKPMKFFWVNAGYWLVYLMMVSAIVVAFA